MAIIKIIRPQINWSNPLTEKLAFDAPFWEGAGANTKEIARKLNGSIVASGATWDKNLFGTDLDFSAAASSVNYTTPEDLNSYGDAFTIEVLALIRSAGVNGLGRVIQKTSGTTDTATLWNLRQDGGTNALNFIIGFSGGAKGAACSFTADSKWHHWVFSCTSLSTKATGTVTIYKDGVTQTLSLDNAGSGTISADDTNLYIGNRSSNNRNIDAKISYVRLYKRALSARDVKSLYANPWRIYKRIIFPFANKITVTPPSTVPTYWRTLMGIGY